MRDKEGDYRILPIAQQPLRELGGLLLVDGDFLITRVVILQVVDLLGLESVWDRLVTEHGVHLLQRLALGLGEEEPNDQSVGDVGSDEDEVEFVSKVRQSDWRDLGDEDVGSPIGASAHSSSEGSDTHGEDFTLVHPGNWSETGTEEEGTEEDDEGDTSALSIRVVGILSTPFGVDGGFNGKTDSHTNSSNDKWLLPSDAVENEGDENAGNDNTKSTVDASD